MCPAALGRRAGGETVVRWRLRTATRLVAEEANALAGLLAAEAHFAVSANNGGTSWTCSVHTALRDDDAGLLVGMQRSTGLGHLSRKAAQRTSRPQLVWSIASKLECLVLAGLLESYPVRGRRLAEAALWSEAVRIWAARRYQSDPAAKRDLERLAARMRELRRYRGSPTCSVVTAGGADRSLVGFFGGFFSGEGCLVLPRERGARMVIKLRRDDRPLLETFAAAFEIGSVVDVRTQLPASPAACWTVSSRPDLLKAIALLDSAPLLGRKREQYLAWRPGALEVVRAGLEGRPCHEGIMEMTRRGLRAAKDYSPPTQLPESTSGADEARCAYVEVLRGWAAATSGPLSCSAYQGFRGQGSGLPHRNTLTRVFGSWAAALEAAGLADRLHPRSRPRAL